MMGLTASIWQSQRQPYWIGAIAVSNYSVDESASVDEGHSSARMNSVVILALAGCALICFLIAIITPLLLRAPPDPALVKRQTERFDLVAARFQLLVSRAEGAMTGEQRRVMREGLKKAMPFARDIPEQVKQRIQAGGGLADTISYLTAAERLTCVTDPTSQECDGAIVGMLYATTAFELCNIQGNAGACGRFTKSCMQQKTTSMGLHFKRAVPSKSCTEQAFAILDMKDIRS